MAPTLLCIGIVFAKQNSSTYWEGKADAESLQRVYGISFPDAKQLKEWEKFQEEAAKRDHRKIGRVTDKKCAQKLCPISRLRFLGTRAVLLSRTLAGFVLFPATRRAHLQHPRRLHQGAVPETRVPGSCHSQHLQCQAMADFRALGALCRKHYVSIKNLIARTLCLQENMFSFEVEKDTFALKPMNCPGHW